MYISARADYALRAMLAVADAGSTGDEGSGGGELVKAASLADSQDIPLSFLQGILLDLRRAGLLHSLRDVWLAVDGAIALVVDRTTLADLLADRAPAP